LINNKVPVYLPHVMLGYALAAGTAVSTAASWASGRTRSAVALVCVVAYGTAATAYYEKWFARERKGELLPYEATAATLRAIVPPGPKYIYASPQFWVPFHAESDVTFYSFAAGHPSIDAAGTSLDGAAGDRPIVLVVDESQWLPELVGVSSSTREWQQTWIAFIEHHCALEAVALGTAHGTLAAYRCGLDATPSVAGPRLVGGETTYAVGAPVLEQRADDLSRWSRYADPRRNGSEKADVRLTPAGVEISGSGWPGIVKPVAATPGEAYIVRTVVDGTRDGDLLYLGTWQQPQVLSLGGAGSAGLATSLHLPAWFPSDRAFRATATEVRLLMYSEAPETDFRVTSLTISRLTPMREAAR
jgi:hypothetical protein